MRTPIARDIFSGECSWDIDELKTLQSNYRDRIIDNDLDDDKEAAVWQDKLPFLRVGNGDLIAIDIASPESEAVVYLDHEGGEGNGLKLGESFADYVDRLTQLACVGSEYWQMLPFTDGPESFLLPDCDAAIAWRRWMLKDV